MTQVREVPKDLAKAIMRNAIARGRSEKKLAEERERLLELLLQVRANGHSMAEAARLAGVTREHAWHLTQRNGGSK